MALIAVVVGLKGADGLPIGVHFSLPGQLAGHAPSGFKGLCRPLAGVANPAIRADPVLHVHQPVLEVSLVQGLLVRSLRPPCHPLVHHRLKVIRARIHKRRPSRHLPHLLGDPLENTAVNILRLSLGQAGPRSHQNGQRQHEKSSGTSGSVHDVKIRRHPNPGPSLVPAQSAVPGRNGQKTAEQRVDHDQVDQQRHMQRRQVPRPGPIDKERVVGLRNLPDVHVVGHQSIRVSEGTVEQGIDAHHHRRQGHRDAIRPDPRPFREPRAEGPGHRDGHHDQRSMLQIEQDEQGQRVSRRQLGRQDRMEAANHAEEAGEREDVGVEAEAQDAQQDGVESAEMKGQRPVDGKLHRWIHQRVDDFKHLHAQHGESDGVPHAAAIPLHPARPPEECGRSDRTGAQRHPESRLVRADDHIQFAHVAI